jgi:hypothetical protein
VFVNVEEAIAAVFERRTTGALFVTEIEHDLGPVREPAAFTAALQRMSERGELIIVNKPAPDPHLEGADLRIAARVTPEANAAIETLWTSWLREFFASHRCS